MEFILSKIISRAPRNNVIQSDCDIPIIDNNRSIDVPSDSVENTINLIDNRFNDNAPLSQDIDTVNSSPKQINCVFASSFFIFCGVLLTVLIKNSIVVRVFSEFG